MHNSTINNYQLGLFEDCKLCDTEAKQPFKYSETVLMGKTIQFHDNYAASSIIRV